MVGNVLLKQNRGAHWIEGPYATGAHFKIGALIDKIKFEEGAY